MARRKQFTASFYANQSNGRYDRREVVRLAEKHAPRNVRISLRQAKGVSTGISLAEARELARPPTHVGTKHFAKNGCTVRDVVQACPWTPGRYE